MPSSLLQTTCINKYVVNNSIAGCGALDYKCVCTNQQFLSDVSCCVFKGCTPDKQQGIIDFAHNICGPDATALPTKATCAPSATGAPNTASGTAPAATSAPNTTAAPNSAASGASSSGAAAASTSSSKAGAAVVGAPAGVLGAVAGFLMAL